MTTNLDLGQKLQEISARIRDLREIEGKTPEEMAAEIGISTEEYISCEEGLSDLNFAFLYSCATVLNVDVTDLIEGTSPRLRSYIVTRNGEGQNVGHAHGMTYFNLASSFKYRTSEPLRVIAAYAKDAQDSQSRSLPRGTVAGHHHQWYPEAPVGKS